MYVELWHQPSGNMVTDFSTWDDAVAFLREWAGEIGDEFFEDLFLLEDGDYDGDEATLVAGGELMKLIRTISAPT